MGIVSDMSSGICATAAIELAGRAFTKDSPKAISRDLATSLVLGLCAAKVVPGAHFIAAAIFAIDAARETSDAIRFPERNHGPELWTGKVVGLVGRQVGSVAECVAKKGYHKIVEPLAEKVIFPVAKKVAKVLRKVNLPMNDMWYVAAGLATVGGAYQFLRAGK